jgi:hypothetical protein
VEKLLSGGGMKVTKGAWQVPKWLAFVESQVVTTSFKGKTECIDHVCTKIKLHTCLDIVNTKISATRIKSYYKP